MSFEQKKNICRLIVSESEQEVEVLFDMISDGSTLSEVILFVHSYNLGPMLYAKLAKSVGRENISQDILETLRRQHMASSAGSMKRLFELKKMLSALKSGGVDALVLKGAYFSEKLYSSPALRLMSDIDLLIKRDDVEKASEIYKTLGYSFIKKDFNIDTWLKYEKHLPEFIAPGRYAVELHVNLQFVPLPGNPAISLDTDQIWKRAETDTIGGSNCYVMSAEDTLIYLSLEIFQDKFTQCLVKMIDIKYLLEKKSVNWDTVTGRAAELKVEKILYVVLKCTDELFGINIEDEKLNLIKPAFCNKAFIYELIDKHVLGDLNSGADLESKILSGFKSKTFTEKLKYLFYGFFSDHAVCRTYGLDENSPKKYLYYFPRALFILKKYFHSFTDVYIKKKHSDLEKQNSDYSFFEKKMLK